MKTITVPKTTESAKKLDLDQASSSELIEFIFNNDDDFYQCWRSGLFEEINLICKKNIDDFETEVISNPDELEKCKLILKKFSDNKSISEITRLVNEAINRKTSIHFFF